MPNPTMRYRFGDFELDPESYRLSRGDQVLAVEPRVLELLSYLVEHRGRAVPKEELLETVWKGQFVGDAVLARAVHAARSALGDSSQEPEWIRTVHGRGYLFAGAARAAGEESAATRPVERRSRGRAVLPGLLVLAALAAGAAWWAGRQTTAPVGDIALLPFVNATGELANEWVKLGLMDQLAARLRHDTGLQVVPSEQTLSLLGSLGIEVQESIAPADLARIERGLGVDRLVSAVVSSDAGLYRLQLTVHGGDSTPSSQSGEGEDLLGLARDLGSDLAAHLGGRPSLARQASDGADATVPSDQAAAYALTQGVGRLLSDDPGSARSFFEAALDRDPGLVAARYRLAQALARLGERERAREEAELALELVAGADEPELEARIEDTLGQVAMQLGKYEEALGHFERALELYAQSNDVRGRIDILNKLGLRAVQRGEWREARTYHLGALGLCARLDYVAGMAAAESGLGVVAGRQGDLAAADRHFEREMVLRRRLGDRAAVARALHNLGANAQNRGDWARAEDLQVKALHLRREVDDLDGIAATLVNLAVTKTWRGRLESADAEAEASLEVFRELGNPRGEAMALYVRAYVAMDRRHWAAAHALTEEAAAIWKRLGAANRAPLALATRAEIADKAGDAAAARRFAAEAHRLAEELGDRNLFAYTLRVRGRAERAAGRPEGAEKLLQEALAAARETGNEGIEGSILTDLSQLLLAEERAEEAAPMVEILQRRFPQSGPAALLEARLLRARGELEAACARAEVARQRSHDLWDDEGRHFLASCDTGRADA